jgi:hypothetical protein
MTIYIKIMTMVMMLLYKAPIPDHNLHGFTLNGFVCML